MPHGARLQPAARGQGRRPQQTCQVEASGKFRSSIPAATPPRRHKTSSDRFAGNGIARTCWLIPRRLRRLAANAASARTASRRCRTRPNTLRPCSIRTAVPRSRSGRSRRAGCPHPTRHRINYKTADNPFRPAVDSLPCRRAPDARAPPARVFWFPNIPTPDHGLELATPIISAPPNRDLTITPHVYPMSLPAVEAQISRADAKRRISLVRQLTYGPAAATNSTTIIPVDRNIRGSVPTMAG